MKATGNMGEAMFLATASQKGLIVSQPFGDCAPYDFIVDNGKELIKVQVKAANEVTSDRSFSFFCKHGSNRTPYNKNDFDYMACYLVGLNMWYIIPHNEITTNSCLKILPFSMKSNKYDIFNEAWGYLIQD